MVYYDGQTGKRMNVAGIADLIEIAKRVKRDKEYGATFMINPLDCAYVTFSTDLNTKDGERGGFCLLWSDGRGYRALKPYAYKNAATALKALLHC
jgi:hypothetical protein